MIGNVARAWWRLRGASHIIGAFAHDQPTVNALGSIYCHVPSRRSLPCAAGPRNSPVARRIARTGSRQRPQRLELAAGLRPIRSEVQTAEGIKAAAPA